MPVSPTASGKGIINPLDWLRGRHVLPPALVCLRCAKRLQVSQRVVHDGEVGGFIHDDCLLAFQR